MRTNITLNYVILTSVIIALLVYIFFSNNNSSVAKVLPVDCDEAQRQFASGTEENNDTLVFQATDQALEQKRNDCDASCLEALISNLLSGQNLENELGMSVTEPEAVSAAAYLKDKPDLLHAVEKTMRSLKDQNQRDSIIAVFNKLPDGKMKSIAQNLASSEKSRDRADAIFLLREASYRNVDVNSELANIMRSEKEPSVFFNALRVAYTINPKGVDSSARDQLSQFIKSHQSESVRVRALIAKTKIFSIDDDMQNDVRAALNSNSVDYKEAGIRALDDILHRQRRGRANQNWQPVEDLRLLIESIANDSSATHTTRIEALNLMRRHY